MNVLYFICEINLFQYTERQKPGKFASFKYHTGLSVLVEKACTYKNCTEHTQLLI